MYTQKWRNTFDIFFVLCVSAWKDRPQCFKTRLRCPFWCVEPGNHPGKPQVFTGNHILLCGSLWNWRGAVEWEGLSVCFGSAFSMSWLQEGFLTPSGIVFLISWHKWWKVNLHSSATQRRGSSPPSSSTSLTYGKNSWVLSQQRFHLYVEANRFKIILFCYLPVLRRMNQKGQSTGSFW